MSSVLFVDVTHAAIKKNQLVTNCDGSKYIKIARRVWACNRGKIRAKRTIPKVSRPNCYSLYLLLELLVGL